MPNLKTMKIEQLIVNDKEVCSFSEAVNIKNDRPLFEIVRKGETILLVNDEPISVVWHDDGSSSGHFYRLNGITIDENLTWKYHIDAISKIIS